MTDELIEKIQKLCYEKYGIVDYPVEEAHNLIFGEAKTEIHTMAMLNDQFIGCIHRQATDRHMLYQNNESTEGCIAQSFFLES